MKPETDGAREQSDQIRFITEQISVLRADWRSVRQKRLDLKKLLLAQGISGNKLRRNRDYRELGKKQRELTVRMRHLEKVLNRKMSRCEKK